MITGTAGIPLGIITMPITGARHPGPTVRRRPGGWVRLRPVIGTAITTSMAVPGSAGVGATIGKGRAEGMIGMTVAGGMITVGAMMMTTGDGTVTGIAIVDGTMTIRRSAKEDAAAKSPDA